MIFSEVLSVDAGSLVGFVKEVIARTPTLCAPAFICGHAVTVVLPLCQRTADQLAGLVRANEFHMCLVGNHLESAILRRLLPI